MEKYKNRESAFWGLRDQWIDVIEEFRTENREIFDSYNEFSKWYEQVSQTLWLAVLHKGNIMAFKNHHAEFRLAKKTTGENPNGLIVQHSQFLIGRNYWTRVSKRFPQPENIENFPEVDFRHKEIYQKGKAYEDNCKKVLFDIDKEYKKKKGFTASMMDEVFEGVIAKLSKVSKTRIRLFCFYFQLRGTKIEKYKKGSHEKHREEETERIFGKPTSTKST